MQIDGKTVAGAGTTALGIIGTVLGGMAVTGFGLNGNCNGGLFGNNNCARNVECNGELTCKDKIAKLEAERYTDQVGLSLYERIVAMSNREDDKINANYVELAGFIAKLDKEAALNKQANEFQYVILNNKINCDYDKLKCYVDATFVPGHIKLSPWDICAGTLANTDSSTTAGAKA